MVTTTEHHMCHSADALEADYMLIHFLSLQGVSYQHEKGPTWSCALQAHDLPRARLVISHFKTNVPSAF